MTDTRQGRPWGTKVWQHKWFDHKCQTQGCQSLRHKYIMDDLKAILDDHDLHAYTKLDKIRGIVNDN